MKHQQHTTIRSIGWLLAVVLGSSAAGCKLDWDFAYDAEGITPGNVAPVLTEITPIATPGNNSTPEYTFHSTQAGSISYGGDCTSPSSSAVAGDNTVQFAFLNDGVYSNCEITVSNSAGQATLAVTLFVVDSVVPAIASTDLVLETTGTGHNTTSTYQHSFSSSKAGTVEYQGEGCAIASGDGSVVAGGNSVALAVKREAYSSSNLHTATDRYSRCEFRVADSVGNVSAWHSVPYIKLDAAGNPLADQDISRSMSDEAWRCVQDVASNLIWEVKTDDGGLQDKYWMYSWYNSDSATNGGNAGTANGGDCWANGSCDTEKFVADVNNTELCGATDWRMPTREELLSLRAEGYPHIKAALFPNTQSYYYWASSSVAYANSNAWYVHFSSGYEGNSNKNFSYSVRLVRGGQ